MPGRRLLMFAMSVLGFGAPCSAQQATPLDPGAAKQAFGEAAVLSEADAGRLWGVPLCGPMLFVEPESRVLIGNQPDAKGALQPAGGVYTGVLPKEDSLANTATEWSGTFWTELMWPLPEERSRRDTLMLHECFHHAQGELPFAPMKNALSPHLDTLLGRYTMRLEFRALSRALDAPNERERRTAISDALLFRAYRDKAFPSAAEKEQALEMNEGLAEYTGVRVGNPDPPAAKAAALRDLEAQEKVPSLVRSFAYATGPAYGLLLDVYCPSWRTELGSGRTLPELLQSALGVVPPRDLEAITKRRAEAYGGPALYAAETERDRQRQLKLTAYRAAFLTGPTITIPLEKMGVQFDPRTVQPLDDVGTVYPEIRISDTWGILEAKKGALVRGEWKFIVLTAPSDVDQRILKGEGWTLSLTPGWAPAPVSGSHNYILKKIDYPAAAVR